MTNQEQQPCCALGLNAFDVGKKFEKIDNIDKNVTAILGELKEQNGRIGRLEKWRAYIIGISVAASVLIPYIIQLLKSHTP